MTLRFHSFFFLFSVWTVGKAQNVSSKSAAPDPLQDSITKYYDLGQMSLALPFAELYSVKVKKEKGEKRAEYGASLDVMGELLFRSGKVAEAEPVLLQGLEIRKQALGDGHVDVSKSLHNLGNYYRDKRDFTKAEVHYLQALDIRKKTLGEENTDVASTLSNLGMMYYLAANVPKAEENWRRALEIREKLLPQDHLDVATSLSHMGIYHWLMGDYAKAEPYFMRAYKIRIKILGDNHLEVARSLNQLANVYKDMDKAEKSEPFHLKALQIRRKNLGENHPDVGVSLNNLGTLYYNLGAYAKAETHYLQALEIRRKNYGENHPDVAMTLGNLSLIYLNLGNYAKAEAISLQALEIRKKTLSENDALYATSIRNLGGIYMKMDNFAKGEQFLNRALELDRKNLGADHPVVGLALHNLGVACYNQGLFARAESNFLQALDIQHKAYGEYHSTIASSLICLALIEKEKGHYDKASEYSKHALDVRKKVLGEDHPNILESVSNLGILKFIKGDWVEAERLMKEVDSRKRRLISNYFPFLSENEKENYYQSKLVSEEDVFKGFCINRYASNKAIAGDLYNDQLASKGLLLSSSSKWRHRIRNSGDTASIHLFEKWEKNRKKLNKLYFSTDSAERAGLDSVEVETEKLVKELSIRSESFAKLTDKKLATWKEVQKTLKQGDAAVEMIRVRKYGISKIVTDTTDPKRPVYKVKDLTDTIYYAALIIKPNSVYPEMVLIKNGNDLEGKHLKFFQNSVSKQMPDNRSYQQFWEKIGSKLGTTKRVFFSPDGVYHQINLNTLQNPKTGKFLLDEKEIYLTTSTKDLLPADVPKDGPRIANLFGYPNFDASFNPDKELIANRDQKRGPALNYSLKLNSSLIHLSELPGTQLEVERVSELLFRQGWEVHSFMREKAMEETIKETATPKLLHIATHGYFQSDTNPGSNPLLRSGLFLSRATQTLNGKSSENAEDGILTAYEAMNLNLDNTDLVVLSACETGLGEIKNGEGVYGLQRAFKVAGAKSIIMSLWKVNDEATQELMVSFYKHWLSPPTPKGAGNSTTGGLRSAFLKAQKELKAKYPEPYFWGAFVMVGE